MVDSQQPEAAEVVQAWEDDPGAPPSDRTPILRPVPELQAAPLPVRIADPAPAQRDSQTGTAEFRYWVAADALRRAADFWGSLLPDGTGWHSTVGNELAVTLDGGDQLNAYYDREGLRFFHHAVAGVTVYSGESPDAVCHEAGHAVLDAVRPELWDAASAEAAALHESFGDCSALLTGLQLDSLRVAVLAETDGDLARSSRLSRIAEQLGWGIGKVAPAAVDQGCLRNAANQFFYRDPVTLPPNAPASQLSSEPHSFSRVFTGAFLRVLAGIFQAQPNRDDGGLKQAGIDAGRLLYRGVAAAPIVPGYFAQVAAHMIVADQELFGGGYGPALRAAFVQHGILSPSEATSIPADAGLISGARVKRGELDLVSIGGDAYGITEEFAVRAPTDSPRFQVAGASTAIGSLAMGDAATVAAAFVEDLFRQGRVRVPDQRLAAVATGDRETRTPTHQLIRIDDRLVLARRLFD